MFHLAILFTFGFSTGYHLDLWGYWHRFVFVKLVINVIYGKSAISILFQAFVINSGFCQSESLRTLKVVESVAKYRGMKVGDRE